MHLIHQNIFEFDCTSKERGKEVQENLSSILEKEFYPKLEILLDEYEIENHLWQIENLTLELPKIKAKNWQQELCKLALEEMENHLKQSYPKKEIQQSTAGNDRYSKKETCEQLILEFLTTGAISENVFSKNLTEICTAIEVTPLFLENLILVFEEDMESAIRYYFNSPEDFKIKVKENIFQNTIPKKWKDFLTGENNFQDISDLETWLYDLDHEYLPPSIKDHEKKIEEFLENRNRDLDKKITLIKDLNTDFKEDISTNFRQKKGKKEKVVFKIDRVKDGKNDDKSDIKRKNLENRDLQNEFNRTFIFELNNYVENAGLVILHPFLKPLFEQTSLCENDNWISEESQHRAILLSQYLISGKTEIFENELVLNKLICGLPIESIVNTKLVLSELEKEKCENLLTAVLEYWKPLQASSAETLRETFLQRNGKLSLKNNNQELWVEEKGVDILLEQLPWGIGTIKTPWMTEFLICNWR